MEYVDQTFLFCCFYFFGLFVVHKTATFYFELHLDFCGYYILV